MSTCTHHKTSHTAGGGARSSSSQHGRPGYASAIHTPTGYSRVKLGGSAAPAPGPVPVGPVPVDEVRAYIHVDEEGWLEGPSFAGRAADERVRQRHIEETGHVRRVRTAYPLVDVRDERLEIIHSERVGGGVATLPKVACPQRLILGRRLLRNSLKRIKRPELPEATAKKGGNFPEAHARVHSKLVNVPVAGTLPLQQLQECGRGAGLDTREL